jgi:ElaA protein
MPDIRWEVNPFQQLTVDRLFEILHLRVEVFVVEQQCSYSELDTFDRHGETRHLTGHDGNGELIAYTRILGPGLRYPEVGIGRFVIKAKFRKQGIGHQLIQKALQEISTRWPQTPVKIAAQGYLHRFYAQYGFIQVSDGYLEDGIPHVEMLRKPC